MRRPFKEFTATTDEVRAATRDASGLFAVATLALVVIAFATVVLALKAD